MRSLKIVILHILLFTSLFSQTTPIQITLNDGQSYNFSTGESTNFTGGDFYLSNLQFWANNPGQRGTIDLGDLGSIALDSIEIPAEGYGRRGVAAVVGHIYVSLAQEGDEGSFIIFRVDEINDTSVTLSFIYATDPFVGGTRLDFVFEFSETVAMDDTRQRAVAFHSITFIDSVANPIAELVMGTPEANALQGDGWFENELSAQYGAFQWAGGANKRAEMHLIIPTGTKAIFMKIIGNKDGIRMNVQQTGEIVARLQVDDYWHNGYAAIRAPSPEPAPTAEPQWIAGRYFPHFPPTNFQNSPKTRLSDVQLTVWI